MCTKKVKELKMKRGYSDVIYLMRTANVRVDVIGNELLQIAIMSYLHDPDLTQEELISIAFDNSPMVLETKEECFLQMKDTLQNLHTKHLDKLDDDNVVFKFICNIASEVRMREMLKLRVVSEELQGVNEEVMYLFCKVAIRRIMKPQEAFKETLNHVVVKEKYDEVENLVIDLYNVVENNNKKQEIEEALSTLKKEMRDAEKAKLVLPLQNEVENLVNVLISEHENMIF